MSRSFCRRKMSSKLILEYFCRFWVEVRKTDQFEVQSHFLLLGIQNKLLQSTEEHFSTEGLWEAKYTWGNGWDGDWLALELVSLSQSVVDCRMEQVDILLRGDSPVPNWPHCVDDVLALELSCPCGCAAASLDTAMLLHVCAWLLLDLWPTFRGDCSCDTTSMHEMLISRVRDCIGCLLCNIDLHDLHCEHSANDSSIFFIFDSLSVYHHLREVLVHRVGWRGEIRSFLL